MRKGLVIGKFMPVHNGHMVLIPFAASRRDELIVSMSYKEEKKIVSNKVEDLLRK